MTRNDRPHEIGRRLREQNDGLNKRLELSMTKDISARTGDPSPFDASRRLRADGATEYWSARDLMEPLDYDRWENFSSAIDRAKIAAEAQGYSVDSLFRGVTKKGAGRPQEDVELARFACYLVAMNGDPRKPGVAEAQAYFAIRTREAETRQAAPALQGPELIAAALIESQKVIEQREARIFQLEQKASVDAPKVTYVDTYVTDADCFTVATIASTHNVTEKALRELLIRKDWIFVQTDSRWSESKGKKVTRNRYSEKADKKRYFRRISNHEAPRFRGSEVMHTLKVTPQGAEAIARLVAKEQAA